jgi:hypothetical protein
MVIPSGATIAQTIAAFRMQTGRAATPEEKEALAAWHRSKQI